MADPLIIDAGPTLTFTAAGQRQLLIDAVSRLGSRLMTPEAVLEEVERKATQRARKFAHCGDQVNGLISAGAIDLLPDSPDDAALRKQVHRVTGMGTAVRLGQSQDLGEAMVIAHALKQKEAGAEVRVFIDEWRAQGLAHKHGLKIVTTGKILAAAVSKRLITDRAHMRKIYDRMREFDDGLVHIDQTDLLNKERFRRARDDVD